MAPASTNPSAPEAVPPRPSPSLERTVTARPWTDAEAHELVTFKSDARARPAWKTIGLRLKRDPEACKAHWLVLRQNMPELNPRTEPEAEAED